MSRPLFDSIIGLIYLVAPFPINLYFQIVLDAHWFVKIIVATGMLVGSASNYIVFYMASSICSMNKVIVKHLHPIQFDKRYKTRQMKLKIDSFIDRLNEEFVGFY